MWGIVFVVFMVLLFQLCWVLSWIGQGRLERERKENIEKNIEEAKEKAKFMKQLNNGHEFWCQAGIENKPTCSCKTVPGYFISNYVKKRYEIIRNLAAARGV